MNSNFDILVYTGGMFQTNGYALKISPDDETVIVIDAPEGIADWLTEQGLKAGALLLTHLHYDHIVDTAAVKERFDCPVYAHSQPDDDLTLKTALVEQFGLPWNVPDFEVDHLLAGEATVTPVEEAPFEILHIPGHSPDSLCFRVTAAPEIIFGGDVLFKQGIGRTDFPHGDGPLLLSGIREKLFVLPDETSVFPGHGPSTTVGEEKAGNPFLR